MPDFDTHAVRIAQDVRQHSIIHAATVRIQSRVRAMHCQRQLLHLQEAAISMAQVEAHRKKEEARALLNERLRAQYKLDWAKKQEQHCQQDNGAPVAKRKLRKKKPALANKVAGPRQGPRTNLHKVKPKYLNLARAVSHPGTTAGERLPELHSSGKTPRTLGRHQSLDHSVLRSSESTCPANAPILRRSPRQHALLNASPALRTGQRGTPKVPSRYPVPMRKLRSLEPCPPTSGSPKSGTPLRHFRSVES